MRELRDSLRCLETDPVPGRGGDDAPINIEAAEMQLQTAHCRLVEAVSSPATDGRMRKANSR